jgi:peroxiredoxin (alkyl hydroperoxide reductase subunit C)
MVENFPLKVGQKVPSFEIETYDPVSKDFGKFDFDKAKGDQKWTILFFYPADFTFV